MGASTPWKPTLSRYKIGVRIACMAMKWASKIWATELSGSMNAWNSSCVHLDGILYNVTNVVYVSTGWSYALSTTRMRISQY